MVSVHQIWRTSREYSSQSKASQCSSSNRPRASGISGLVWKTPMKPFRSMRVFKIFNCPQNNINCADSEFILVVESCIAGLFLSGISSNHCVSFQKVKPRWCVKRYTCLHNPRHKISLISCLSWGPNKRFFVFLLNSYRSSDARSLSPGLFPPSLFSLSCSLSLARENCPGPLHGSSTSQLLWGPSGYPPDPSILMFLPLGTSFPLLAVSHSRIPGFISLPVLCFRKSIDVSPLGFSFLSGLLRGQCVQSWSE